MTKHPQKAIYSTGDKLIIVTVVASILAFFALIPLYGNSKTDGHGNGWITVDSCQEKDWAWHIYSCKGWYHSGAGMIETPDASVTVIKEYKEGERISDVYPPFLVDNEDASQFITGQERSSVKHNLPWLLLVFSALILMAVTVTYRTAIKKRP